MYAVLPGAVITGVESMMAKRIEHEHTLVIIIYIIETIAIPFILYISRSGVRKFILKNLAYFIY